MSSSGGIAGGDVHLSVDKSYVPELEQARTQVRAAFQGMSDDALKFASAQDRYDRALKASNGRITASVRNAELNLRRVQTEAARSSQTVVRSSSEAAAALGREERAFGRLGRGALAGTGLLRGFGRSIAFASSSFLGGFGLIYAIESATKAASEQQVAEGQLETALKNRGQVVEQVRGQINGLVAANAALGFGEHDVTAALTLGVTTTGNLAGATRLLTVAQNVARAKGIDLYAATQLVVKGFLGQSRGLKSLGVDIGAGVKGWQALDAVQAKYSGRAVAFSHTNAGAFATERAELERTKVTIGNELLPAELRLANAVSGYLGKASNQAKIQHDVNAVMTTAGHVAHDFGAAYDDIAPAVRLVSRLLGGSENTVRALGAAFIAMKLGVLPGLFRSVAVGVRGVGAAAAVSTGEVNVLAAAEARAAAAGAAMGGGGLAPIGFGAGGRGVPGGDPSNPIPLKDLRAAGEGGLLSKFGLGRLFASGATDLSLGAAGAFILPGINQDTRPGVRVHTGEVITQKGKKFVIIANRDGSQILQIIPYADYVAALKQQRAKPQGSATNDGFATADLSAPTSSTRRPTLDRLTRINLAVQQAQTDVARGTPGASEKLIGARRDEIAYDVKYEKIQQNLERTDPKHLKEHAAILQGLLADEESARSDIASIEDEAASKRKAARDKAATAARKAHQAALASHRQALASRLGGIETQITTAQTAEQQAPNLAKLKLTQARERHARELLVAFYVQEAHDPLLTKSQRAAASKNAAKARQDLARSATDNTAHRLKVAVEIAETSVAAATEGTAAYARAIIAEKKALAAEIAYDKAVSRNAKASVTAKDAAIADRLAAQKKLASLDKKTKTPAGGAAENQRQFLADVQRIIGAYAPNAFPTAAPTVSTGKLETHGYDTVNELRGIRAHLRDLASGDGFPASDYQSAATVAAIG